MCLDIDFCVFILLFISEFPASVLVFAIKFETVLAIINFDISSALPSFFWHSNYIYDTLLEIIPKFLDILNLYKLLLLLLFVFWFQKFLWSTFQLIDSFLRHVLSTDKPVK